MPFYHELKITSHHIRITSESQITPHQHHINLGSITSHHITSHQTNADAHHNHITHHIKSTSHHITSKKSPHHISNHIRISAKNHSQHHKSHHIRITSHHKSNRFFTSVTPRQKYIRVPKVKIQRSKRGIPKQDSWSLGVMV